jgi:carbon-monoxide dehydrogenase medium subunit
MESALTADFSADALANIQLKADDMNSDLHASAQYRAHLCGVMARRAVIKMTG